MDIDEVRARVSTDEIPAALVEMYAENERRREQRTQGFMDRLTEWERRMIREAAVMGWVQGKRHHDMAMPGDTRVTEIVLEACLSEAFRDLYPVMNHIADGEMR